MYLVGDMTSTMGPSPRSKYAWTAWNQRRGFNLIVHAIPHFPSHAFTHINIFPLKETWFMQCMMAGSMYPIVFPDPVIAIETFGGHVLVQ